jgi:cysteine-rich repeat protein
MGFTRARYAAWGATLALAATLTVAVGTAAPAGAESQGPNSPGTVVSDSSFGTYTWFAPGNAAVSDDLPAWALAPLYPAETQYLKATGFGFTIPVGAVIEGIRVEVEKSRTGAISGEIYDVRARIVKGSVIGTTDRSDVNFWPPIPGFETVVSYGGSSDLWGETWTASDINDGGFGFAISASITFPGLAANIDAISITVFYILCGNGQIDPGEDCDDGNTADGDCCSSTCQFDGPGTPCPDATLCNGDETCDGAGGCNPGTPLDCDDDNLCTQDSCDPVLGCVNDGTPVAGCRSATKSLLIMKNRSPDTQDKVVWKWIKGQSTAQADFGVPTGTTQYALCIYNGTASALVADYTVPGDSVKWSPISTKGYTYTDSSGAEDGITKVTLKGSTSNKSKCLVKGKGTDLADPDLEALDDNNLVIVQLVNDSTSVCFESRFEQPDFITFNDPAQFKAKAQ